MDDLPFERASLHSGSRWGASFNEPARSHPQDLQRPSHKILEKHPYPMNRQRASTTAFGLIAWLEQTQIHHPLKAIECRFEATGAAVDDQIKQIFQQSASHPQ